MSIKAKQLDTSGILERDAAPTLGANLNLADKTITTDATDANVKLAPNGTGSVEILGNGGTTGNDAVLKLNCSNNNHYAAIQAPPHTAAASYVLILPDDAGTNGQVLSTNGIGQLDWIDVTSGLTSTDDLPQGTTNLYYTDTKVDTRIAAASIDDLSDVNAPAPSDGDVLEYSSGQWSAVPASSGASRPTVTLESGTSVTISAPSSSDLEHIYYFTSGSAVSVTLPSASGITGYKLNLKRTGTGAVSITADGTETIDNSAASISLATQYDSYTLVSNGSGWFIL